MPESVAECTALHRWAESLPENPAPATIPELSKHLEYLSVTLPRQATDNESGKKRTAVYARMLRGYSSAALAFMSERAFETLDWFPTPHQCLEILREYPGVASERDVALSFCQAFWQGRMDAFMTMLREGAADDHDVAAVPEQWRRVAMERGHLRLMDDGTYVIRRRALDQASDQK